MSHDEHCGCGCDCDCGHDHRTNSPVTPAEVSDNQKDFLRQLGGRHYMPVARFTVKDSREEDFASTALAPVFLCSATEEMASVKERASFLQELEDMGLITLDYDLPLGKYGYEEYKESALYAFFCTTVAEGATKPDFLGDTPVLELGSMALTEAGEAIAASPCGGEPS